MKKEEIQAMQRTLGVLPDGDWGPKSRAALQAHLRKLMEAAPQRWPGTNTAALTAFFGNQGDESNLVTLQFPYAMFYDGKRVYSTRVHLRVHASLLRVLRSIAAKYGHRPEIMEEAQDFGGVFNNRPVRNGSTPSTHAWGVAIDLDDDDNGNTTPWPTQSDMPLEILEEFAREGWVSGAAFFKYAKNPNLGRDAMHFQATAIP